MIKTKPSTVARRRIRFFLITYLLTLGLFCLGAYLLVLDRIDGDSAEKMEWWGRVLQALFVRPIFYFLAAIPYLVIIMLRSFMQDYRIGKWPKLAKGVFFRALLPTLAILLLLTSINRFRESENFSYTWDTEIENKTDSIRNHFSRDHKQRGIHAFNLETDLGDLEILKRQNIEWITLTPFIPQENYQTPSIFGEFSQEDSTEYMSSWQRIKEESAKFGFKIHLKPHIWLMERSNGKWRSDIAMKSPEDWQKWFQQYENQMLAYAQLATAIDADLFCIGTELHQTAVLKPELWEALIQKIKTIYDGPLTYAANWNAEVDEIPFWEDLDYIGVQAYFPLADRNNPSLSKIERGWQPHIDHLEALHERYDLPVLFTEMGYKSTADAAIKPWAWNTAPNRFYKKIAHQAQVNCYQAFFNTVWKEDWMAGVHIWEWQSRGQSDGQNNAFSLEGKPALNVVAKGFGQVMLGN